MHYLLIFILSVKGTLLFALFASNRWPVTFFRICTSLTFTTDKCSYGIAIFTGRWFTIRFYILLAFLTYSACITLSAKEKTKLFEELLHTFILSYYKTAICSAYIVCWNSDLQYIHFTTGNAPLHS